MSLTASSIISLMALHCTHVYQWHDTEISYLRKMTKKSKFKAFVKINNWRQSIQSRWHYVHCNSAAADIGKNDA